MFISKIKSGITIGSNVSKFSTSTIQSSQKIALRQQFSTTSKKLSINISSSSSSSQSIVFGNSLSQQTTHLFGSSSKNNKNTKINLNNNNNSNSNNVFVGFSTKRSFWSWSKSNSLFAASTTNTPTPTTTPISTSETVTSTLQQPIPEPIPSSEELLSVIERLAASAPAPQIEPVLPYLNWGALDYVINPLLQFHEWSQLPWWAEIVAITIGLRVAFLPVSILLVRNGFRTTAMQPEQAALDKRLRLATEQGNWAEARELQKQRAALPAKYGISVFRSLGLGVAQAPFFIGFFLIIRKMCYTVDSFKTGGALWFPDLSQADPYFLLPIGSIVGFVLSLVYGTESGGAGTSRNVKIVFICLAILGGWVTASFPAGLHVYWFTSSILGLIQMLILKRTPLANWVKPPELRTKTPPPLKRSVAVADVVEKPTKSTNTNTNTNTTTTTQETTTTIPPTFVQRKSPRQQGNAKKPNQTQQFVKPHSK